MSTLDEVRDVLTDTLTLGERGRRLAPESGLLGELAELDSMAVPAVIAALEERFDIAFEDCEIDAEVFATLASLAALVEAKRAAPCAPEGEGARRSCA